MGMRKHTYTCTPYVPYTHTYIIHTSPTVLAGVTIPNRKARDAWNTAEVAAAVTTCPQLKQLSMNCWRQSAWKQTGTNDCT